MFQSPPEPPFLPGQSPFHVRGLNYMGMRERCDSTVPGGLPAVLARLPSDPLRRFFDQTFLAVAMYDALPIAPLTLAIAQAEGRPHLESVYQRAIGVAKRDMGFYRSLMSFVSPELAIKGLSRIWTRYFDFGYLEASAISAKHWEVQEVSVPALLAPWFSAMSRAYLTVVLDLTGVQGVAPHFRGTQPSGSKAGLDLVTVRFDVTWR